MNRLRWLLLMLFFILTGPSLALGLSCQSFIGVKRVTHPYIANNTLEGEALFPEETRASLGMLNLDLRYTYVAHLAQGAMLKDIAADLNLSSARGSLLLKKAQREVDTWSEKYLKDRPFFMNLVLSKKKVLFKKNHDTAVNLAMDALSYTATKNFSTSGNRSDVENSRQLQRDSIHQLFRELKDSSLLEEAKTFDQITVNQQILMQNLHDQVTLILQDATNNNQISQIQSDSLTAYYQFLFGTLMQDPNLDMRNNARLYRYTVFISRDVI